MSFNIHTFKKVIAGKSALLMMFFLAQAVSALADTKLYMEDFGIAVGETKEVALILNNDKDATAIQAKLELPAGLTYVDGSVALTERVKGRGADVQASTTTGKLVILLTDATIDAGEGAVVTFEVKRNTLVDGEYELKISDIVVSDAAAEQINTVEEATVKVEAVGLNDCIFTAAESIEVLVGQEYQIDVNLTNDGVNNLSAFQGKLTLPEGLEVVPGEDGKFIYSDRIPAKAEFKFQEYEGYTSFVLSSSKNDLITGEEGVIFSFKVKATKDLAENTEILLSDLRVAATTGQSAAAPDVKISVYNASILAAAKDALQDAITAAEAIETEGKKGVDALNDAIAAAKAALAAEDATTESLTNALAALAEAVEAFDAANATIYIEADLTAQFPTNYQGWVGATGEVGWAAPKVTTNDGREVAACERYDGTCANIGDVFSRTLTGLANGVYRIELYGAAAYTAGRGFESELVEGDETAVYLYAETSGVSAARSAVARRAEGQIVKQYIPAHVADNFNGTGIATAVLDNVVVTDGTVKLGMYKEKPYTNWHVVQIKGVTAKVEAEEVFTAALTAAQTALAAEENAVVTGEERTALEAAIANNSTVAEQTAEAYEAAIKALNEATATFTGAKAAYADYAAAQAFVVDLPYAKTEKKPATEAATSAADATAKAAALIPALRAYYESNAQAEAVEGAVDMTSKIINPAAEEALDASVWETVLGEGSGGSIDIKSNEPWTDGSDNATHKYFDGGNWGANAWDVALQQNVTLPAGKYLLTAKMRAAGDVEQTLFAGETSKAGQSIGAAGGVFNRGWNDTYVVFELTEETAIAIGVRGVTANKYNWMSFSDFRLVQLEKALVKPEPIEGALYSWESPEGLPGEYGGTIAYVNGDGDRLNYKNGNYYTICLNGKKANMNDETPSAYAGYMLVTLDEALTEGDTIYITAYVNKNASMKSSAYIVFDNGADVESDVYSDEANIDPMFNGVPTEKSIVVTDAMAGAKSFKMTRGQTGTNLFITKFVIMKKNTTVGIKALEAEMKNGSVYNLQGQKMNKAKKGLYIINGKKVVIK